MSILVIVQNEKGEQIDGAPTLSFQKIVSWENRWRFPMLGFIDPLGITVLNRLQVKALVDELREIQNMITAKGISATILDIGSLEVEKSMRIVDWEAEKDLSSLLESLHAACEAALERYHRYLWFLGD